MLNVALVGLMAGSLLTSSVTGDDDKDKKKDAQAADEARVEAEAPAGIFTRSTVEETSRAITQDTYSFGAPSDAAPIKIWVSYAYGETDQRYDAAGNEVEYQSPVVGVNPANGQPDRLFDDADIITQRGQVGAQLNLINFPAFKLGGGAQLTIAKNRLTFGEDTLGDSDRLLLDGSDGAGFETDYELQNIKVFGTLRGRVLGIHGGYIFDIAEEGDLADNAIRGGGFVTRDGDGNPALITDLAGFETATGQRVGLSVSDERNAIFFGADFDASGDVFRAFGGVDYFYLADRDDDPNPDTNDDGNQDDFIENEDYLNFMIGAGVKLSIFEIGASAQITTRFRQPLVPPSVGTTEGIGGHAGTIAPYLRISPSGLPASIFVRGAVLDEYHEYGYAIGGANAAKSKIGFTAGLAVGFD